MDVEGLRIDEGSPWQLRPGARGDRWRPAPTGQQRSCTVIGRLTFGVAMILTLGGSLSACASEPGYGGRSSEYWIEALADSSEKRRVDAAAALGEILDLAPKSPRVVQALLTALRDESDDVRIIAADALSAEGVNAEGALDGIHEALHDSAHADVRRQAALILGRIGTQAGPDVAEVLTHTLEDSVARVRAGAAEGLGRMGRAAGLAIPKLAEATRDRDPEVRMSALSALPAVGAPAEVLVPLLRAALRDSVTSVRSAAAYLLHAHASIAAPAVPELASALSDADATVRLASAMALGQIGPGAATALPQLRTLATDADPRAQRAATEAIRRIQPPG